MMSFLLTRLVITLHNLWTFNTLKHHAKTLLPNTATYFFTSEVHVFVNPGPDACYSQDKGTPPHSRQKVCRQSEHTDKFYPLIAHQTVTVSPDNACSTVQPQKNEKKTQRCRERLYLNCQKWDVTQNFSTTNTLCTGCPNEVIHVCVYVTDKKQLKQLEEALVILQKVFMCG